jgi:hypothetical protein
MEWVMSQLARLRIVPEGLTLALIRWIGASPAKAIRLDVAHLPVHLKRDLGLADGRLAPPRNPLSD